MNLFNVIDHVLSIILATLGIIIAVLQINKLIKESKSKNESVERNESETSTSK